MSLMERIDRVEGFDVSSEEGFFTQPFDELRQKVQMFLPASEMARLIERSPLQAKSEIRLACEQVLRDNPWIARTERQKNLMVDRFLDEVFGFGPLEDLLEDESVTEIMVNGSRSLYFERNGKLEPADTVFSSDEQVYALIDKIVGPLGRRIDESSPMVNARLRQGHRVNAIIPPLALDGPILTIRKFRSKVFSLEELEVNGSFDARVKRLMSWAVLKRCNIAVSGGTGSGKTTILNALSLVIPSSERIVTIEDSAELKFEGHPHVVRLEARPRNAEGVGEVSIRELVINALRMRPDRIVVGECRGAEALDMLQAMNTGHDGSLTTLHANSSTEAIFRLTTMVRYGADLPIEVIEAQIASAIDLVVQTARSADGRRYVSELVGYSYDRQSRRCEIERYYFWDEMEKRGVWCAIPSWFESLSSCGIACREEVESWMDSVSLGG